jgi:hypothetical protein
MHALAVRTCACTSLGESASSSANARPRCRDDVCMYRRKGKPVLDALGPFEVRIGCYANTGGYLQSSPEPDAAQRYL